VGGIRRISVVAYLQPPKQNEVAVQSVKAGKFSELERDAGKILKFGTSRSS